MIMLDPSKDALGKGFHIIQSTIAVGSGGVTGRVGRMVRSRIWSSFLNTTDFISAVYLEEFGFIGSLFLVSLYFPRGGARTDDRSECTDHVFASDRRCSDGNLLYLRLCKSGNGSGYLTCGWCTFTFRQFWWHRDDDHWGWVWVF